MTDLLLCVWCGGTGQALTQHFEDQYPEFVTCSLCQGWGHHSQTRVILPHPKLKEALEKAVRALEKCFPV